MQTAGFNSPLATYLVLPEAELAVSVFGLEGAGGGRGDGSELWNRKAQADRWPGRKLSRPVQFPCETGGGQAGEEACRRLPGCSRARGSAVAGEGKIQVHASVSRLCPNASAWPPAINRGGTETWMGSSISRRALG